VAAVLLVVTSAAALSTAAFLATETGRQALLDRQVARQEWFGLEVADEDYAEFERQLSRSAWLTVAAIVVGYPSAVFAIAAGLYLTANRRAVRPASYQQILAVVAHAGVLYGVHQLVATAWGFRRESFGGALSLGALVPGLDEGGFLGRLLGGIDVFYLWAAVVLAIGLSVLYERPARRFLTPFVGGYAAVAAALALIGILLGGA
jgi:hypothetical protein